MRRRTIHPIEETTPLSVESPIIKHIKFVPEELATGAGRAPTFKEPEYLIPKNQVKSYERMPYFVGNCLVIGSTGSGKSVAIANILLNVEHLSHVYLFVKTLDFDEDESYRSVLTKRKIPFSVHEIQDLAAVIADTEAIGDKKKDKPLIILDDIGTDLSHNLEFLNFIKHARKITNGVIVSIQSHEQIPPGVYKNMKRFMLFTNLPENEVDTILDKMPSDIPKDEIRKAIMSYKKPYNFILIDMLNGLITEKFSKILYSAKQ
jgi:hypothetical protein